MTCVSNNGLHGSQITLLKVQLLKKCDCTVLTILINVSNLRMAWNNLEGFWTLFGVLRLSSPGLGSASAHSVWDPVAVALTLVHCRHIYQTTFTLESSELWVCYMWGIHNSVVARWSGSTSPSVMCVFWSYSILNYRCNQLFIVVFLAHSINM